MKTNMKYPILIFLLFHFPSLLAQNLILPDSVQLGAEGYESLYKLLYCNKEFFKQQQCPVTKKPFDKGVILQEDIAGSNGGLENFSPEIDSSSISTVLLFGQGKIELGVQLKIFVFEFQTKVSLLVLVLVFELGEVISRSNLSNNGHKQPKVSRKE